MNQGKLFIANAGGIPPVIRKQDGQILRPDVVDKYRDLVIGRPGLGPLLAYGLVTLLSSWVPGALGLFLRSKLYPLVLGRVGRNVVFGVNVTLRHPHKISIGDNVVIDDGCCLDAKGTDNHGLAIGTGVFVGRNTILSCKNGDIAIHDRANIGFNCEIFSASRVRVGKSILMAAYTCLVGGDHLYDRVDIPVLEQGRTARGNLVSLVARQPGGKFLTDNNDERSFSEAVNEVADDPLERRWILRRPREHNQRASTAGRRP